MSDDSRLKRFALSAFSNHVSPHFKMRRLERRTGSAGPIIYDWDVEYPDGKQVGGDVLLREDNGSYAVCIAKEYNPGKGWTRPNNWEHGFIEEARANS